MQEKQANRNTTLRHAPAAKRKRRITHSARVLSGSSRPPKDKIVIPGKSKALIDGMLESLNKEHPQTVRMLYELDAETMDALEMGDRNYLRCVPLYAIEAMQETVDSLKWLRKTRLENTYKLYLGRLMCIPFRVAAECADAMDMCKGQSDSTFISREAVHLALQEVAERYRRFLAKNGLMESLSMMYFENDERGSYKEVFRRDSSKDMYVRIFGDYDMGLIHLNDKAVSTVLGKHGKSLHGLEMELVRLVRQNWGTVLEAYDECQQRVLCWNEMTGEKEPPFTAPQLALQLIKSRCPEYLELADGDPEGHIRQADEAAAVIAAFRERLAKPGVSDEEKGIFDIFNDRVMTYTNLSTRIAEADESNGIGALSAMEAYWALHYYTTSILTRCSTSYSGEAAASALMRRIAESGHLLAAIAIAKMVKELEWRYFSGSVAGEESANDMDLLCVHVFEMPQTERRAVGAYLMDKVMPHTQDPEARENVAGAARMLEE